MTKIESCIIFKLFLDFSHCEPSYSYRLYSYAKKCVLHYDSCYIKWYYNCISSYSFCNSVDYEKWSTLCASSVTFYVTKYRYNTVYMEPNTSVCPYTLLVISIFNTNLSYFPSNSTSHTTNKVFSCSDSVMVKYDKVWDVT